MQSEAKAQQLVQTTAVRLGLKMLAALSVFPSWAKQLVQKKWVRQSVKLVLLWAVLWVRQSVRW
jgi:hypothetical protein